MSVRKRLVLLNPHLGKLGLGTMTRLVKAGSFPAVLSILEAMTPEDYEVVRYDNPLFVRYEPGLVAITSYTMNVHVAYRYADGFRRAGARVVMGGPHVMFRVEEALEHCDAVCVGEAETVWGGILRDYENDRLQKVYDGKPADNFWEYYHERLLKLEPWQIRNAILATRGCKFRCEFCVISSMFRGFRHVPVEKVVELIEASKQEYFSFNDANIYGDPRYAKELFKALIPLGIGYSALCSVDLAKDEEALELARQSGCAELLIGFETMSRGYAGKNPGKLRWWDEYRPLIRRIRGKGVRIKGTFIVGFDEDTSASLWRLFLFTLTSGINLSAAFVLTPLPGTELFRRMDAAGRILSYDWRRYDLWHAVVRPAQVSRAALIFWVNMILWQAVLFNPLAIALAIGWLIFWKYS
ncbi:MAG: radical SAM protein [Elusimicrobia bacterium]|nr:radical SAM protein [Elusimicrobiota bacterium]